AICRQGEPGWTAFYILTTADVETVIRNEPIVPNMPPLPAAAGGGARYRRSVADLVLLPENAEPEGCATIYLSIPGRSEAARTGWLGRANRRVFGGATTPGVAKGRPKFIPIDAPTDLDGETLQAFLKEGDLFGEMSCLNRSPRSATIIAARD